MSRHLLLLLAIPLVAVWVYYGWPLLTQPPWDLVASGFFAQPPERFPREKVALFRTAAEYISFFTTYRLSTGAPPVATFKDAAVVTVILPRGDHRLKVRRINLTRAGELLVRLTEDRSQPIPPLQLAPGDELRRFLVVQVEVASRSVRVVKVWLDGEPQGELRLPG